MEAIKITMPFICMNSEYTEVTIEGEGLIYSEANIYAKNMGYGLQVNNKEQRDVIKKLCFDISEKVKELHILTNNKQ